MAVGYLKWWVSLVMQNFLINSVITLIFCYIFQISNL